MYKVLLYYKHTHKYIYIHIYGSPEIHDGSVYWFLKKKSGIYIYIYQMLQCCNTTNNTTTIKAINKKFVRQGTATKMKIRDVPLSNLFAPRLDPNTNGLFLQYAHIPTKPPPRSRFRTFRRVVHAAGVYTHTHTRTHPDVRMYTSYPYK